MKTKAELCVEIAKDVLLQIKSKKIVAEAGVYFILKTKSQFKGKQLQEVLPRIKKCEVCALGSLFYSFINKHNDFKIDDEGLDMTSFHHSDMRSRITMFPIANLELIECAFENRDVYDSCENRGHYAWKTIIKAKKYRGINLLLNDEKALIHIMKNIIRNKGTFKP